MKKLFYKIGALLCAPLLGITASCDDWFTLLPQSEMVAEDFWKDEQDVLSAVGACYRAMNEEDFMRRLLVWGEVRSDNVVNGTGSDTDLSYILNANINAANSYVRWGSVYTVINICNTVIQNAPLVREHDADFTESSLNQYLAEAKAIRAFCYFTLVRAFNNVPYVDEPYLDDTRPYEVSQSSCESILDTLIADLRSVEDYAVKEYADNVDYTRGRVTQKAVWALLADMYLWLDDYENCIEYCNKIIASRDNPLTLLPSSTFYNSLFSSGNSDESIWELQFDNNTQNGAVRSFYGGVDVNPLVSAYDLGSSSSFFGGLDIRNKLGYAGDGIYGIKKYVASCYSQNYDDINANSFSFSGDASYNWIIYRLADAYLIKAEALAELGGTANLEEAVELVSLTYDRAHPDLEEGSLTGQYTTQSAVRNLVFDERQREFLYEGKRYFDLVRRMRREGTTSIVNTYLIRKYTYMSLDETTVRSKLDDRDAIYLPIHEEELRVNPLLVQNRFYMTSEDISRN